jgi:putative transposase
LSARVWRNPNIVGGEEIVSYWRTFYHLIWATKNREALITTERMEMLQQAFRVVAKDQGAYTCAIGGMPDHVHVAVSIPPTIAVSEYVGRLKGSSSRYIGKSITDPEMESFLWQSKYGVLTFGERSLPDVVAYIENQPRRHAENDLWPSFEQLPEPMQPQNPR